MKKRGDPDALAKLLLVIMIVVVIWFMLSIWGTSMECNRAGGMDTL